MPGKYLRGALVSFSEGFPTPVPNLILFQYNPEHLTHSWSPAHSGKDDLALGVSGEPTESFSFELFLDGGDSIADDGPIGEALARASGVAARLAALEMLLFPTAAKGKGLLGSVSAAIASGKMPEGGVIRPVPVDTLPTVLFVWGPGRVLPVRVSQLTIVETLYDALLLYPTHAKVQMSLQVLTQTQLEPIKGPLGEVARAGYAYTQALREALAIANLANSPASIAGMLPL